MVVEGPTEPSGRPFVAGAWSVEASPFSSTCGRAVHEPFGMTVVQNADIVQFVIQVEGFGPVRYDGRLTRSGEFTVDQSTVYATRALEDRSTVEGRFGTSGTTLSGTETEVITDLRRGTSCRVLWRWNGSRR